MPNTEQKENWNGESGRNWVRLQAQFDGALAPWLDVLAEGAGYRPGLTVLDIGCGCGATTFDAATRCGPTGLAVGVDLSEGMVAQAQAQARAQDERVGNVHFLVGDAQVEDLASPAGPYDVAVSRFGVMFFDDPVAAFANIARAVRPGGCLAVLTWAAVVEQEWITVPLTAALEHLPFPGLGGDGPGMFGLSDPDRIAEVLTAAGWQDVEIARRERRILVGGGGRIEQTMEFLAATGPVRALLAEAGPEASERALAAIAAALDQHHNGRGVELGAVAWLITAERGGG